MHEIEQNLHFFSENPSPKFDKSLLGLNLNASFDSNFKKVKNLNKLFETASRISLEFKHDQRCLRQEVFPLENRLVKMYFTSNRSIVFESFALDGKLIKSDEPVKYVSSFPIQSVYGNRFVVGFTSFNKFSVHLYDSDLNLIQAMEYSNLVESIYMNETNIVLFFENRVNECCEVYDLNMNLLSSFGQNLYKENAFYMPKSVINNYQDSKFCFKFNSKIFGLTTDRVYLSNYNNVYVLCRNTGKELRKMELSGYRPYFMMDTQGNVLLVNSLDKRIAIFSSELEFLAESFFNDELDCVHVNHKNKLHFVDTEKKSIIVI